jgi:uncharacterized glyoxalase superfamily protein PhnB
MPRLTAIAPFFLVADVVAAAEYYRDRLGFSIRAYFFEDPPVFAMVARDGFTIMLSLITAGSGGSNRDHKDEAIDAYLYIDDVDALYAEFQQSQATIATPPQLRVYGMKELEVRDLDGHVLCFGEDVPQTPSSGA